MQQNNKRIAKNTLLLYFRMLFTMAISLYTSRVVLATLGTVSYTHLLSDHKSLEFARDIFLFSFYMRGMSFIDLAYLRKKDLNSGFVSYSPVSYTHLDVYKRQHIY